MSEEGRASALPLFSARDIFRARLGFHEEGEGKAYGVILVSDAAVVEGGEGDVTADRDVEGSVEAVVLCVARGCGGIDLLLALAGGGVDGGRVEGKYLVGIRLEAHLAGQVD
jgi:hypothetical protein